MPYRVLDLSRVLAGPWATQILGDQGFDVIKVEAFEGDETRQFLPIQQTPAGPMSVYFACTNRNKRSICLDLKNKEARELIYRLARGMDVVVENFRPGVMERLGLHRLIEENPRLIIASISAFGSGPLQERAGYDLVLQSMGGIAALTADPPQKAGPSIADLASAMTAVQGILFALLEREKTGKGKHLQIRMFDVQHSLLAYFASSWLNAQKAPGSPSNAHPSIAPYNLYRCKDGYLAITCSNEPLYLKLKQVLKLPEDPRFETIQRRVQHREILDRLIEDVLADDTVAEWEEKLVQAGIPCGPVLSVPESLNHPAARQLSLGPWTFPMPPLVPVQYQPPPRLGEHGRQILREAGVSEAEIEALVECGALQL
jgi:crotonobetainyl-CoA:carnitine CoA-transferase CaiB-like acyl-CoA transferase